MRLVPVLLALCALAASNAAQGTGGATPGSGIFQSRHDFKSSSWNTNPVTQRPGELCAPCHMPHVMGRPADRTAQTLLWSHQMSTHTNYVLYTSPTMTGAMQQPVGTTRMCLSCHDGTVGRGNYHLEAGSTSFISPGRQVPGRTGRGSNDCGADHPVSMPYSDGPAGDRGLRPRGTPFGNPGGNTIEDLLEGGRVECKTCHDVHNIDVPTAAGIGGKILRVWNMNPASPSALCLACHAK